MGIDFFIGSLAYIYGLIASIFVKGVTSRDGLKLIFAGMLGGYLGGQIGIFMDVPENLWWMREVTKFITYNEKLEYYSSTWFY